MIFRKKKETETENMIIDAINVEASPEESTKSVIDFLKSKDGKELTRKYFELVKQEELNVKTPNFSSMVTAMGLEGGTTKEGILIDSYKVRRAEVTNFLKEEFEKDSK